MIARLTWGAGLALTLGLNAAAAADIDTTTSSAKAWPSRSVEVFRGAATQPSASADLRIGGFTAVIENAPLLLAAERFNAGGGVVRNAAIPALLAGDLDLAGNAETQALRQSVQRPDLRIILTVAEGRYRIVARRSHGVSSVADLRGKRVGTVKDSSADFFLHKMLQRAGLGDSDVTVVSLFPIDRIVAALASGEVDAVAIWEPAAQGAVAATGDDAVVFTGDDVYREIFNLNTTAATLADAQKRKQLVAYVRSIIASNAQLHDDPQQVQRLSAAASGNDVALVRDVWPYIDFRSDIAPELLDTLVIEEGWLAARDGRRPRGRAELARLIDASVLDEAIAGH